MKTGLEKIISDVRRFHRGCGSMLIYKSYSAKINRSIGTEAEKTQTRIEIIKLLEVKP